MRENRPSGSMSGTWKQKPLRHVSTLPKGVLFPLPCTRGRGLAQLPQFAEQNASGGSARGIFVQKSSLQIGCLQTPSQG